MKDPAIEAAEDPTNVRRDFDFQMLSLAHDEDCHDLLWWRVDDSEVRWFVNCNDWFYWGAADLEQVTAANIEMLRRSFEDVRDASQTVRANSWLAPLLFCCRVRQMRPQGAAYKLIDEELWGLFDAVGPEREIDFANPYNQEDEYLYQPPEK